MMSVFHLHFATWWGHCIQLHDDASPASTWPRLQWTPLSMRVQSTPFSPHLQIRVELDCCRFLSTDFDGGRIDITPRTTDTNADSEPSSLLFVQQILLHVRTEMCGLAVCMKRRRLYPEERPEMMHCQRNSWLADLRE